jgi:hypothetical protein
MIEPVIYGEVRGNEGVIPPTHCAITGRLLESGDITKRIKGTPYSFGVKAEALSALTPEKLAEIIAAAPKPQPSAEPVQAPVRPPRQSKESE